MFCKRLVGLSAMLGICMLAACTTSPEEEAGRAEAQARFDAAVTARKGESVSRICPGSSDGWKALGDNALLMEARGEWYLAELSGSCDPDSTFAVLATRTGSASSCLQRGDDIFTGRPRMGGRCMITGLYKWNEDTGEESPASANTAGK